MGEPCSGYAVFTTDRTYIKLIYIFLMGLFIISAVGEISAATNADGSQEEAFIASVDEHSVAVLDFFEENAICTPYTERTNQPVLASESGELDRIDTEQGWIRVDSWYYDDPLPLCLTPAELADWFVLVEVYGGYEPFAGTVWVYQKDYCTPIGEINVTWTWIRKGPCCAYDWWQASFNVTETICLASNDYPDPGPFTIDTNPYCTSTRTEIPRKYVKFEWESWWQGCHDREQHFTIKSVHS